MTSRRNPRNYETSPLLPHPPHINSHLPVDFITFSLFKDSKFTFQICSQIIPVIFAVFINLLDAVTFGTCFFPAILGKTSSLAIDLFLLSTLVVQVVLVGMSSFQCGLGTSMAENIPFIHTMALGVYESMRSSHSVEEMMPTILTTLCVSTVLNGLAFYLVGYFQFGYILHFFPRHVILGMTFGFGIFLLLTGFQVTTGIQPDSNILYNIYNMGWNNLIQFSIVCCLELLLRILSKFEFGETAGPLIMFIIPVLFYIILWCFDIPFEEARDSNWLFPLAPSTHGWDMWNQFFSSEIHWAVVMMQLPTILSLTAFTLLLVPIRIPTLSMITGDEVDFDSELKAQGMGNIISGALGSVHNYLSYSNSVFFYNIGGTGKTSQLLIALLTGVLFLVGPQIINLVPRIIAGVIMLHLAFDLLNDSTIASRRALDSLEYTSVILVGAIVTIFGFVPGIIAGGVSACVTFVVQSSKGSNVRGVFTGEVVRSNTSWTGKHRDKLEQGLATHGVYVIQLQGHIFFGNIQQIVKTIEQIIQEGYKKDIIGLSPFTSPRPLAGVGTLNSSPTIETASYDEEASVSPPDPAPEYVVLDCSFVSGLDGNAVDGLLKLQRLLQAEDYKPNPIFLTFAGLQASFQDMFSVHLAEFSRRFGMTPDNDDFLSTFEPSERTRLLSLSSDDERGVTLNLHTKYQPTDLQGVKRDINDSVAREILKRKSHPRRPKFKRMRSEPPNTQFHSDVNTALQVVEEHIIESVDSPRRSPYQKHDREEEQNPLHTSDSFRRLDSFDELDSFVSDAPFDANEGVEQTSQLVGLSSTQIDSRKRAKSHPIDLSSSYIPDDNLIPSSIKIVSPLKDISRTKHLFATTEMNLPLTIGMSHGVCGLVTSNPKQIGTVLSPRDTLLSLANDERSSISPLENISPPRPPNPTSINPQGIHLHSPLHIPDSIVVKRELSLEIPDNPAFVESRVKKSDGIRRRIQSLLRELSPTGDVEVLGRLAGHLRKQVITVDEGQRLWSERDPAVQMGFLISGRLEAVIGNNPDRRTLQVIIPGTFMGELGFLSGKIHSRTIIAKQPSMVALLTKDILADIESNDIVLLCTLQKLALKTAAWRSCQLMLFSAGSLGPK